MSERRVVITGIGVVSPVGNNKEDFWKSILAGKSGIRRIQSMDTEKYDCKIAGEVVDFDPAPFFNNHKEARRADRYFQLAMAAAKMAAKDSGLNPDALDPHRVGVMIGSGIGGLRTLEQNHEELIAAGPRRISPFLIPAMISNLAPGNIAIKFNLQGVNYTITSACTSGTHAVGEAFRMISGGLQDVVVTGGAEAAITPLGLGGFGRMRALSTRNDEPERASRPFDKDRDGFVIGEGSGILVLEELESAKKRGAKIYAEVVGYGFSCDAYHITAPPENGAGAVACMRQAIEHSKLSLSQVRYINAHGTSTPINDPAESRAIRQVYGADADKGLMVSSTKSMTGHSLGAAGGLEAIFCTMSVHTSVIPPTINLENPDEGCDLDYVPNTAREVPVEAAMSNSFGFGGTNASVIVRRFH